MKTMATKRNANRFMLIQLCIILSGQFVMLPLANLLDALSLQTLGEVLYYLLPAFAVAVIYRRETAEIFPLKSPGLVNLGLAIAITLLATPFMLLLGNLSSLFYSDYITGMLEDAVLSRGVLPALIAMAVAPAVCEEVSSRGVFLHGYKNATLLQAALMNGLFFGMIHFNLQQFPYAFAAGALFAVFVRLSGSILVSMAAHLLMNGSQILLMSLALSLPEAQQAAEPTAWESIAALGAVTAVTLPIAALLLRRFIRRNHRPTVVSSMPGEKTLTAPLIISICLYIAFCAIMLALQYIYSHM